NGGGGNGGGGHNGGGGGGGGGGGNGGGGGGGGNGGGGNRIAAGDGGNEGNGGHHHGGRCYDDWGNENGHYRPQYGAYRGRVVARTGLRIRSAPNATSLSVGFLPYGALVRIACKVNSQLIGGNPRWYKLDDHHYAWSSARYINNLDRSPRYCGH
ncbi:SH3 domain-containing protein, partial [Actinacidiphila oryziradicis]